MPVHPRELLGELVLSLPAGYDSFQCLDRPEEGPALGYDLVSDFYVVRVVGQCASFFDLLSSQRKAATR